jgi:Protein of unknown function (DUF1570)
LDGRRENFVMSAPDLRKHKLSSFFVTFLTLLASDFSETANGGENMVRAVGPNSQVVGKLLGNTASETLILGRDGQLWALETGTIKSASVLPNPFHPFSAHEIRGELLREFGEGFDVSGTGHFIVVHPAGEKDRWAGMFEDLYRRMLHYFSVRGISVHEPAFPLVAIVLGKQADFQAYARRTGRSVDDGILGYYDPRTNRILMYDVTAGGRVPIDWGVNAATIVHEAAHQTAFNVGLHNRFSATPRWLTEGLGTLFEARGVFDSRSYGEFRDRVNVEQLVSVRSRYKSEFPRQTFLGLLASDQLFDTDPQRAYALSWSLTFMLSEQEPRKLAEYLSTTASRPAFREVTPTDRLTDFVKVFGNILPTLDSRVWQFLTAGARS